VDVAVAPGLGFERSCATFGGGLVVALDADLLVSSALCPRGVTLRVRQPELAEPSHGLVASSEHVPTLLLSRAHG
jgi:hypothetical protein